MRRRFVLAGFIAVAAFAQSPAPRFEIADVHVSAVSSSPANQFMRGGFYRGGRYEVRNASMVDLIRTAYGVDPDKVTGGPAWLGKDRFDVIAKAPADSTAESLKLMLQALLADRFKLIVHNDTKPLPAYALTVGKKVLMKPGDGSGETGCKLQPQAPPPAGPGRGGAFIGMNGVVVQIGPGSFIAYSCHNVSMAAFPDELRSMVLAGQYLAGNCVVDETELKGTWNFDFKYSPKLPMMMANGEGNADLVTLFDAVDKQLGLKLEMTKIPMPVISVDSANETPTENLPGVTEKMPALPTEFEVADIKPTDPNAPPPGPGNFLPMFQPGGRVNLHNQTMANLISLGWSLNGNPADRIVGLPKSFDTAHWDIVAKASTSAPLNAPPNGQPAVQSVDFDSMRIMLQALLKDRFHLVLHEEERPMPGYALVAVKPKLKAADPSNRPGCKEGPGADGKDPRIANPAASRLVTCLNMTMAEFAQQIPLSANGYFGQFPGGVVDATKLDGKYDITLSFSAVGLVGGIGGGGRGGGEGGALNGGAGQASDPGGGITLQEAIEKQLGLKLEPQKNPATALVIDHVDEKPTDN
jgi:uncharacterized protein (TIGR03435 family)